MTMPIPDGSVVITPRQMYDQIGSLSDAIRDVGEEVRSVKAAIDPAVSEIRADVAALVVALAKTDETTEKHGNRLTVIETKLLVAWGAIGLLLIALGVLAAFRGGKL